MLYVGMLGDDVWLLAIHRSEHQRFEIDGAHAAGMVLERHGLPEEQVMTVWEPIALHTTPEIPRYKQPEVRLVTLGVQYDRIRHGVQDVPAEAREQVIAALPRTGFKDTIVDVFYAAMRDKPDTAYGTFHTDILAARDATYVRPNFLDRLASSPFAE